MRETFGFSLAIIKPAVSTVRYILCKYFVDASIEIYVGELDCRLVNGITRIPHSLTAPVNSNTFGNVLVHSAVAQREAALHHILLLHITTIKG